MEKALSGIRVLGATRMLAGPYAEILLADMGAEVLHIELPGFGDEHRHSYPQVNGVGTCFLSNNRNKKSITLNLSKPEGQQIFKDLAKISDIVVENNRPGTMAKWNIGYEQLKEVNPGIIMTSISGYGQTGPYRDRTGLDYVAQSIGGLMGMTGMPDGPPMRTGNAIADSLAGMFAAYGTLAALHYKQKTGLGQYVDCALVDSVAAILENLVPNYDLLGLKEKRVGNRIAWVAPYNTYTARDGYVVIGVTSNNLWDKLCQAMGREELINDPKFATPSDRVVNVDDVDEVVQAWVSQKTVEEVVLILAEAGVPSAKVHGVDTMVEDPQIKAREMFVETEYPSLGKFRVPGIVPKLSLTPGSVDSPPPTLGQHNDDIYRGLLKFSNETMKALAEAGII